MNTAFIAATFIGMLKSKKIACCSHFLV